jgi:hypothetical protein
MEKPEEFNKILDGFLDKIYVSTSAH